MRYWISTGMYAALGVKFPYGTLLINLLGCYLVGLLGSLFIESLVVGQDVRQFILIGILGGFTTFSTFTYEALQLFKERDFLLGGLYVGGHYFFCLLFVWLGNLTARAIASP
jgi:CrcB protein